MSIKFRRLSPKLIQVWGVYMDTWTHAHWCPACAELHHFFVEKPTTKGASWQFDGNAEAPTFTPSMNIAVGPFPDGHVERCHYFVKGGKIEYLGDSTHTMAGRTIELPDIPHKALAYMPEQK